MTLAEAMSLVDEAEVAELCLAKAFLRCDELESDRRRAQRADELDYDEEYEDRCDDEEERDPGVIIAAMELGSQRAMQELIEMPDRGKDPMMGAALFIAWTASHGADGLHLLASELCHGSYRALRVRDYDVSLEYAERALRAGVPEAAGLVVSLRTWKRSVWSYSASHVCVRASCVLHSHASHSSVVGPPCYSSPPAPSSRTGFVLSSRCLQPISSRALTVATSLACWL